MKNLVIVRWKNESFFGPKKKMWLLTTRALAQVLALIFFYSSMKLLAPSDVSALGNTAIIFTAILSKIFLKEKIGIPHLISVLLIISGVILIAKPTFLFPRARPTISRFINTTEFNQTSDVYVEPIKQESKLGLIGNVSLIFNFVVYVKSDCNNQTVEHWNDFFINIKLKLFLCSTITTKNCVDKI